MAWQAIMNSELAAARSNHLLQEELEPIAWSLISEAFVVMFAAADCQPGNMRKMNLGLMFFMRESIMSGIV